jgi:hypothetical protein
LSLTYPGMAACALRNFHKRIEAKWPEPFTEFADNRNFIMSFARGPEVIESFYNETQGITAARVEKNRPVTRDDTAFPDDTGNVGLRRE